MRVARGLSGFLSSRCWILSPRLELKLEPEVSSPVLTWIWGFSRVSKGESGLISSGDMHFCFPPSSSSSVRLSVELTQGPVAFPQGATGLSHMPP